MHDQTFDTVACPSAVAASGWAVSTNSGWVAGGTSVVCIDAPAPPSPPPVPLPPPARPPAACCTTVEVGGGAETYAVAGAELFGLYDRLEPDAERPTIYT